MASGKHPPHRSPDRGNGTPLNSVARAGSPRQRLVCRQLVRFEFPPDGLPSRGSFAQPRAGSSADRTAESDRPERERPHSETGMPSAVASTPAGRTVNRAGPSRTRTPSHGGGRRESSPPEQAVSKRTSQRRTRRPHDRPPPRGDEPRRSRRATSSVAPNPRSAYGHKTDIAARTRAHASIAIRPRSRARDHERGDYSDEQRNPEHRSHRRRGRGTSGPEPRFGTARNTLRTAQANAGP